MSDEWTDEDKSSSAASDAEEDSAEEDPDLVGMSYKEIAALRQKEHAAQQRAAAGGGGGAARAASPPLAEPLSKTWARRADPYMMLPRRYGADAALLPRPPPHAAGTAAAALCAAAGAAVAVAARRRLRERRQQERHQRELVEMEAAAAAAQAPAAGPPPADPPPARGGGDPLSAALLGGGDDIPDFHPSSLCRLMEDDRLEVHRAQRAGDEEWWKGNADRKFDRAQGILQRMVDADRGFREVQRDFMDEHCEVFDDEEENKLVYWDIYQRWVKLMERYVHRRLEASIPGFCMDDFLEILQERGDEVSGEVWDLLLSLTDFDVFKAAMLEHKEGGGGGDSTDEEFEEIAVAGVRAADDVHRRRERAEAQRKANPDADLAGGARDDAEEAGAAQPPGKPSRTPLQGALRPHRSAAAGMRR